MIKTLYIVVGLAVLSFSGIAFGEDCPSGLDGNLCRAENGDRRAMYMVARAAYVKENEAIKDGATVVDFSQAYEWAWKSKKLGFQGGNSVLKMIYVNAPMHKNPVEAHRWITRALNDGETYLVLWLQRLEDVMTQTQIQEANSKILD
tara:strand:- start:266 stop:706 length:441 start_codon:yes stop_codon:yes gene_type:complete